MSKLTDIDDINNWLIDNGITSGVVMSTPDGYVVDVLGEVNLSGLGLKQLPVKFNHVHGKFDVSDNKLTSVESFPYNAGHIDCSFNQIKTLKGDIGRVEGNFICSYNPLEHLNLFLQEIGGNFDCSHCKLDSLAGSPEHVRGNFDASHNQLKHIDMVGCRVRRDFNISNNPIDHFAKMPKQIAGNLIFYKTNIHSLKGLGKCDIGRELHSYDFFEGLDEETLNNLEDYEYRIWALGDLYRKEIYREHVAAYEKVADVVFQSIYEEEYV